MVIKSMVRKHKSDLVCFPGKKKKKRVMSDRFVKILGLVGTWVG